MQQTQTYQHTTTDAIFISPHLDDAVLSAAHTILTHLYKKQHVTVVTVFTKGSDAVSPDIQKFLSESKAVSADQLFQRRQKEDRDALLQLGKISVIHLPYTDGLFRTRNARLLYPSFDRVFGGILSAKDTATVSSVTRSLIDIKNTHISATTRVYTCLSVGNHVDHVLTYAAATFVFGSRLTYWEDIPYRSSPLKLFTRLSQMKGPLRRSLVSPVADSSIKRKAISRYRSQLTGLYDGGLSDIDYTHEILYTYRHA